MPSLQLVLGPPALAVIDVRRFAARQQGQALIEYALIVSLIAVVAIVALQLTGTNIKGLLTKVAGEV